MSKCLTAALPSLKEDEIHNKTDPTPTPRLPQSKSEWFLLIDSWDIYKEMKNTAFQTEKDTETDTEMTSLEGRLMFRIQVPINTLGKWNLHVCVCVFMCNHSLWFPPKGKG